jgi:two-component system, chemotaxis family, protein-glutamate methylesterase/glutaminase
MRALVVDDSVVYRKLVSGVLSRFSNIDEITTAANGKIALDKAKREKPDLITLDVEMPGLSGIEVLGKLVEQSFEGDVIIISSQTKSGAKIALKSLELGAIDVVAKPEGKDFDDRSQKLYLQLLRIVDGIVIRQKLKSVHRLKKNQQPKSPNKFTAKADPTDAIVRTPKLAGRMKPNIVAIGASTGGPNALTEIISSLPKNFQVPIVIVLHMPASFTGQLARTLNKKSAITVVEATNRLKLENGVAYLAPGGKQMKVVKDKGSGIFTIILTNDPPENNCKPSVDYLFRSIATAYPGNSLGVILTGMGADGVQGLMKMKQRNAEIIAQDEESCVVFGMPGEAIKAGVVDAILPLNRIAARIVEILR